MTVQVLKSPLQDLGLNAEEKRKERQLLMLEVNFFSENGKEKCKERHCVFVDDFIVQLLAYFTDVLPPRP